MTLSRKTEKGAGHSALDYAYSTLTMTTTLQTAVQMQLLQLISGHGNIAKQLNLLSVFLGRLDQVFSSKVLVFLLEVLFLSGSRYVFT